MRCSFHRYAVFAAVSWRKEFQQRLRLIMRSLFLRILLWFGVAMVLAAVASFVIGVIAERRARDMAPPDLVEAFEIYSQTAADTFERDGSSSVAKYLQRIEQASGINAGLIDEHGFEVS